MNLDELRRRITIREANAKTDAINEREDEAVENAAYWEGVSEACQEFLADLAQLDMEQSIKEQQ